MASKFILITGANSGIGYTTSKVIALESDSFHIIMAGRSLEKIETAVSELSKQEEIKGSLSALQLEVTDEHSLQKAAAHVEQHYGRLDVLINNAGAGGLGLDTKTAYELCLATNVLGPALVSDAFRPLLLKSESPYSIFVSSGARTLARNATQISVSHEKIAPRGGGAYQVSKAAMNMVALIEHRDHASEGLKVFVVSPGFVRSNLRGDSAEAISGWGQAGDPEVSGGIILDIVQGEREADVGGFLHKDGVYPW